MQALTESRKRHRTERAGGQFKSPLVSTAANSANTFPVSGVRLTPEIQALERRAQLLKRAIKIKAGGEADTLEALARKWTEAGREVAWEVWTLVHESANDGHNWGWATNDVAQSSTSNWGWANPNEGETADGYNEERESGTDDHAFKGRSPQEEEGPLHTIGTMLRQFGIAPETLGWDDASENFVGN
ncbi:hypothetical protein FISHEDRAFT_48191 [Fistulina hepatica ATCC 64428]|uniref:Uncharacterized protein n=1 Tax=Fistulina hepatica ATCC 64428 TaxID=1128425 RepID=A0A0D7A653_9AGAR|nr:hypothetical protein FISHEDRAFT_48191 [Fistulina hepatica ATCC 64428]